MDAGVLGDIGSTKVCGSVCESSPSLSGGSPGSGARICGQLHQSLRMKDALGLAPQSGTGDVAVVHADTAHTSIPARSVPPPGGGLEEGGVNDSAQCAHQFNSTRSRGRKSFEDVLQPLQREAAAPQ